jgi:hypothetical protein
MSIIIVGVRSSGSFPVSSHYVLCIGEALVTSYWETADFCFCLRFSEDVGFALGSSWLLWPLLSPP